MIHSVFLTFFLSILAGRGQSPVGGFLRGIAFDEASGIILAQNQSWFRRNGNEPYLFPTPKAICRTSDTKNGSDTKGGAIDQFLSKLSFELAYTPHKMQGGLF